LLFAAGFAYLARVTRTFSNKKRADDMARDKKRLVALVSVAASATMTVLKLVVALATGSLGILSEAIHSLLDLVSSTMTFFAVRLSDQPPDKKHPYGHGKVEALSALFATMLLVITSLWIAWEAVHRLVWGGGDVEATWYAVALIVGVIVVDVNRSRALLRVARETNSQALEADALHYTSDILSSAAVLLGICLTWVGWAGADSIAALIVAVVVLWAAKHLGFAAIEVLIDTAPEGVDAEVEKIAIAVDGVSAVDRVRSRKAGAVVFIEIALRVNRALTWERERDIRSDVAARVREAVTGADVVVHSVPVVLDGESVRETVRAVAGARGLEVHDVNFHTATDRSVLTLDVEIDENVSIKDAHAIVTELEDALSRELGSDLEIVTHMDPRRARPSVGSALTVEETARIEAEIRRIGDETPKARGLHHFRVGRTSAGYQVSFHCLFADDMPLREAHIVATELEQRVCREVAGVDRVVVHTEPEEGAAPV